MLKNNVNQRKKNNFVFAKNQKKKWNKIKRKTIAQYKLNIKGYHMMDSILLTFGNDEYL